MNTMLSVRMDQTMLSRAEIVAKNRGYLTTQEYMREVVRQDMDAYYRAELDKIIASARKVTPQYMTPAQRDALALESPRRKLTAIEKELLKGQKTQKAKR